MFEAKFTQGGLLKKLLDGIKDLVSAANFDCTAAGLGLHAMDSSHIALVSLQLRHDAFAEYRCDKNRNLGISIANLCKLLKCCDNDDVLTIQTKDDGDRVAFHVQSKDGCKAMKFEMALMDIDTEQLMIPDTQYSVKVAMSGSEFARIVRDLSQIGEAISISVSKMGVTFSTSGETGQAEITCQPFSSDMEVNDVVVEMDEPVSLPFSAKYLTSFAKATPLSDRVILRLAHSQPVSVEYNIEDAGFVKYYLAPKIEDGMDEDEY